MKKSRSLARFDLNLLSALDALLNECNVTRAADRLNVTQPTMSGMLQRLRYQFEDELLVRNGRGMDLTDFAQGLIGPVREALKGIEALVPTEMQFDPLTSIRTFTIMASDYCTAIFLPHVIEYLCGHAPGVRLVIEGINSPIEKLRSGEIDLCISTDNFNLMSSVNDEDDRLESCYLFTDRFMCLVPLDHPLDESSTFEEYLDYRHVGVQMSGVQTIEEAAVRKYAPEYKPDIVVPDFALVPFIVARAALVGVVQKHLSDLAECTLPVRSFTPPFDIPEINETMMWHPRYSDDMSHRWLRSVMTEQARRQFPGETKKAAA